MKIKNLLSKKISQWLLLSAMLTGGGINALADTWYAYGSWNNWQISDTYKFTENSSTDFTAVFTLNGSGTSYEFVITNSNKSTWVKCKDSNVWMSRDGNYYTNNMSTSGSNNLSIWLQKNSTIRLKWNGSGQLYVCINEPQCIAGNQCFDGLGDWSSTTKNLNNIVTRLKGTSIRYNTFKRNGTTPQFKITDGNGWKNGDGIEFVPDNGTITRNAAPVELHQKGGDYDNLKLDGSTQNWYYSFMVLNYNVSKISVLETKESPVTISNVNHGAVQAGSDVSISASLSASVTTSGNGAQYAYIYCITSETLYKMTISGTTATGSIPASVNTENAHVEYYVITSPLSNLTYNTDGFDYLYLNSSDMDSYTVTSVCIDPEIIDSPSTDDITYCQGGTATALSVTATGTDCKYQWKQSTSVDDVYENVTSGTGANTATYTPSTANIGTLYYKCEVTACETTVTSNASGAITVIATEYYLGGNLNATDVTTHNDAWKLTDFTPASGAGAEFAYRGVFSFTGTSDGNEFPIILTNCDKFYNPDTNNKTLAYGVKDENQVFLTISETYGNKCKIQGITVEDLYTFVFTKRLNDDRYRITFDYPHIAGTFNDWSPDKTGMSSGDKHLSSDGSYRLRYYEIEIDDDSSISFKITNGGFKNQFGGSDWGLSDYDLTQSILSPGITVDEENNDNNVVLTNTSGQKVTATIYFNKNQEIFIEAIVPCTTPTAEQYPMTNNIQIYGSVTNPTITPATGAGTVKTVYYTGINGTSYETSTDLPQNAGTYKVTVDVNAGDTYCAADGIDLSNNFIIKNLTITADRDVIHPYEYVTLTAKFGDEEVTAEWEITENNKSYFHYDSMPSGAESVQVKCAGISEQTTVKATYNSLEATYSVTTTPDEEICH